MEDTWQRGRPNPRQCANPLSVLFFWWTVRLFKEGYTKDLTVDDLYRPLDSDATRTLGDKLEREWLLLRSRGQYSVLLALLRTFLREIIVMGVLLVINELIVRPSQPLLLGLLLSHYGGSDGGDTSSWVGVASAAGTVLVSLLSAGINNHYLMMGYHVGARMRAATCCLLYRKTLRMSSYGQLSTSAGHVTSLLTTDMSRLELVTVLGHFLWLAPATAVLTTAIMYWRVGVVCALGVAVVFVVVPVQAYTGKLSAHYRRRAAYKTDERVRLMDEIICGIRVIKMYAWERPFGKMIKAVRKLELAVVRMTSYIRGVYMMFGLCTTRTALFTTVVAMAVRGEPLTAAKVFVTLSYLNILAQTMSMMFVRAIAEAAECVVSLRRVQDYMMLDELSPSNAITQEGTKVTDNGNMVPSMVTDNGNMVPSMVTGNVAIVPSKVTDNGNMVPSMVTGNGAIVPSKVTDNGAIVPSKVTDNGAIVPSKVTDDGTKVPSEDPDDGIQATPHDDDDDDDDDVAVSLNDAYARWDQSSSDDTLVGVNIVIKRGTLVIIVGQVGAGKSSLLHAILGELPLSRGSRFVSRSVSYCSQEPWLFPASIRGNVIFGDSYHGERYHGVLHACALRRDMAQLSHGDTTMIGERGTSLSGGQRARINLARAVYRDADIYLLDDPLSAVDTHVSKHLFDECIHKFLANKTRILVTHQIHYLEEADHIILVHNGHVVTQGSFHTLLSTVDCATQLGLTEDVHTDEQPEEDQQRSPIHSILRQISTKSKASEAEAEEREPSEERVGSAEECPERGRLLLLRYFRSGVGLPALLGVATLFVLAQGAASGCDYFVSYWVSQEEAGERGSSPALMSVYSCLVAALFLLTLSRSLLFYHVCLSCSRHMHERVFSSVVRAHVAFFDRNPAGRILNRFSKDMGAVDELLPKAIMDASQIIMMMLGCLAVAVSVNYLLLLPLLLLGTLFMALRHVHLRTSTAVKRLEAVTKSPVLTHMHATYNGLPTIRAYGAQAILMEEFEKHQDRHTAASYTFLVTSSAFGFALDLLSVAFIATVTFTVPFLQGAAAAEAGVAITQALAITGMMQWGMRQSAEVSNLLTSVHRLLEYCELEAEPSPSQPPEITPPPQWPVKGQIEFVDVSTRYSEGARPVLEGLTFVIRPSEKVGVVGRTGAGKSSLLSTLLLMSPHVDGDILVDGVHTKHVTLHVLRSSLAVIPQEPVLFKGSVRSNLDPHGDFPDYVLWTALRQAGLEDTPLDLEVAEGGGTLSAGQRQLVCLCRAIVRCPRVLLLDEATANVDPQTDALLQHTLRTRFHACTVVTVAHRLHTIIDCDRVLVLDGGRLVEFDHPHVLLQDPTGHFSRLVRECGRPAMEQLMRIAEESYRSAHQ